MQGLIVALVLTSAASTLPVPEGHVPIAALQLCPPGGAYVELIFWAFDCVTDVLQVCSFVSNQDWFFAISCTLVILFTILLQFAGTEGVSPLELIRRSIRRGVVDARWIVFKAIEYLIEGVGTGLIAPYGMALNPDLNSFGAVSASLGIMLSVKSMATGYIYVSCVMTSEGAEQAEGRYEALKAMKPKQRVAVQLWYSIVFASELCCFALASAVLHPIVTIPFFLANFVAIYIHSEHMADSFTSPIFLFVGAPKCSLFGNKMDPFENGGYLGQPIHLFGATVFRIIAWSVLACSLNLPHGILPFGTFGRPMGACVLFPEYLAPAGKVATAAQLCIKSSFAFATSQDKGEIECSLPESDTWSAGAMIFRTLICAVVVLGVPTYIIGTVSILICNPAYRKSEPDLDFTQKLASKAKEIREWGVAQENDYEQLPSVSVEPSRV